MQIKIFVKIFEGKGENFRLEEYKGEGNIKGMFVIVKEKEGDYFWGMGGGYEWITSHDEIYQLAGSRGEGRLCKGFFGIFPERETIIFFDQGSYFKKEDLVSVAKGLADFGIKHACILCAPRKELDFTGMKRLNIHPAFNCFLEHYYRELVWKPIPASRLIDYISGWLLIKDACVNL